MGKDWRALSHSEIMQVLGGVLREMPLDDYANVIEHVTGAVVEVDSCGEFWLYAGPDYAGAFGDLPEFKYPRAVEFAVCTSNGRWFTEIVKLPRMDDSAIVARANEMYAKRGSVKEGVVLAAVYKFDVEG